MNDKNILIITEDMVDNLSVRKSSVVKMHAQDGFQEVGDTIKQDIINIVDVDLLILLIGRADLWQGDNSFRLGVAHCLESIRVVNKKCIVMFAAIIPTPGDTLPVKRTAAYRHGYLSHLAGKTDKLEFCKPGKNLLCGGVAIKDYFDANGHLNEMGSDIVTRGIEAKINCAGLLTKHGMKRF